MGGVYGSYNVESDVDSFTDKKIRNEAFNYYLDDENIFQLLIDFNDMTWTKTDEKFEITLTYKKKNSIKLIY